MEIASHLKDFEEEISRKRYRPKSISTYVANVTAFLCHFKDKDSPKHISEQDIKQYLGKFKGHNSQRSTHSAIKCFYKYVIKQPNKFKYIEYCRKSNRLPIVLSMDEMQRLIMAADNLKHKGIICLMYSTGMRVGEVINLKISDINPDEMIINVIDAKGGEDRQVPFDPHVRILLREYFMQYDPKIYLFNGQNGAEQYTDSSIRQFLNAYAKKAGIKKKVNPHLIRHCHATHLLEAGTEMSIIQRILGHKSIKTTQIYSHISHNLISSVQTPISLLAAKSGLNNKLLDTQTKKST